jgi:hypothetical protein
MLKQTEYIELTSKFCREKVDMLLGTCRSVARLAVGPSGGGMGEGTGGPGDMATLLDAVVIAML